MPELGHTITPADRKAREARSCLFQSLQWEVLWEEGRLGMLVGGGRAVGTGVGLGGMWVGLLGTEGLD